MPLPSPGAAISEKLELGNKKLIVLGRQTGAIILRKDSAQNVLRKFLRDDSQW